MSDQETKKISDVLNRAKSEGHTPVSHEIAQSVMDATQS